MGCVASTIDREGKVRVCKERKKLMKQLLEFREDFADAHLAYMTALKNTGVTLRQFTESESLEIENTHYGAALHPLPPPPPPPPPPPLLPASPELRKYTSNDEEEVEEISQEGEGSLQVGEDGNSTPPPPPPPDPTTTWDSWFPFESSSQQGQQMDETIEQVEEESWAEANTDFEEETQDEGQESEANTTSNSRVKKPQIEALVDDSLSVMSWCTRDSAGMAMVQWKSKKTLEGIAKELDHYFLKVSTGAKEIAVLMDLSSGHTSLPLNIKENKRKRSHSSKVFSALSWSWPSKSLQFSRDSVEVGDPSEPCRPGAHGVTLEKLYTEEKRLYKEVKEEEITKLEHERKSLLLQKLEDENRDWSRTEKARLGVESLQSDVLLLQQSISRTCLSILKLIDTELYPQLITLTSGLMRMWRTMYECHQAQSNISQQMNHLSSDQRMEPTTDYHRQAIVQLEIEVTNWYNSFCKVVKFQREYVKTMCRWIRLAEGLVDDQQSSYSSIVRAFCEKWLLALDKLPDKVASEAVKSFLSAIHSIYMQMVEEHRLQKKSYKLERRLQKELYSLAEMEHRLEGAVAGGDAPSNMSPRHPLSVKRVKTEALRKRAESEKEKFANSVQVTQAMILNNLKTTLPSVFQALMGFSGACIQAFESIHNNHDEPAESFDDGSENLNSSDGLPM